MNEKRHFQRIQMDGQATLICGDRRWESHLLDVSLKGALIAAPAGWSAGKPEGCQLELALGEAVIIVMEGSVVHNEEGHLGFRCDNIELDSIVHLKRLVELNLGSEKLLERELAELAQQRG